jgi:hypothetical protein
MVHRTREIGIRERDAPKRRSAESFSRSGLAILP